jgi:hypothetical protein
LSCSIINYQYIYPSEGQIISGVFSFQQSFTIHVLFSKRPHITLAKKEREKKIMGKERYKKDIRQIRAVHMRFTLQLI